MRPAGSAKRARNASYGVTLIELVIVIAVLGVTATTILGAVAAVANAGSENLVAHRAAEIAAGYLDEICARPFDDPDGVSGEVLRSSFDDARDYNGLVDSGARDQFGTPLAGLQNFNVSVRVAATSDLPGVPAASALRVDVSVVDPAGRTTLSSGYLTRY